MEMIFRRKWEAAHRFHEKENRKSKCAQPHGHTWNVEVVVATERTRLQGASNILTSFESVKKDWHDWIDNHVDHCFKLNVTDPMVDFVRKDNPEGRLMITPGDPTTEILCVLFKAKLEAFLKKDQPELYCREIRIDETQTNSIRFAGNPQAYLPIDETGQSHWWNRADMSTHDLY